VAHDLPVSGVVPILEMFGEDEDETQRLLKMEKRARDFISSFAWCEDIRGFYYGAGIGDVFGVFLAHIEPVRESVDEYLWIVVGDFPSAYLATDDCPGPREALEGYIWEMRKWVALAKQGKTSKDVIPVNVPATPEWAERLEVRLNALEQKIIPSWFTSAKHDSAK
jgi:hypothetical protein